MNHTVLLKNALLKVYLDLLQLDLEVAVDTVVDDSFSSHVVDFLSKVLISTQNVVHFLVAQLEFFCQKSVFVVDTGVIDDFRCWL